MGYHDALKHAGHWVPEDRSDSRDLEERFKAWILSDEGRASLREALREPFQRLNRRRDRLDK